MADGCYLGWSDSQWLVVNMQRLLNNCEAVIKSKSNCGLSPFESATVSATKSNQRRSLPVSDHPLGSLIEDPALPQGHPLSGAVGVSASMPCAIEPINIPSPFEVVGTDAEFRKAVVASARQTIRAAVAFRRVKADEQIWLQLAYARKLAEAILKDLGEPI